MAKVRIWNLVLLALTVSLSHPTLAEEAEDAEKDWRIICRDESILAEIAMMNRQYGLKELYEWMDDIKGNVQVEDWYIRAFRVPVYESRLDRDKAISQFSTDVYLECVDKHKPKAD